MSPDDTRIWALIVDRHGRAAAISAAELAARTGLPDRAVRKIVKALIEVHGAPIASSPNPPAGYYIPESLSEIIEVTDSLKGRALSILVRLARLRRVALPEVLHQLTIELAREEDAA